MSSIPHKREKDMVPPVDKIIRRGDCEVKDPNKDRKSWHSQSASQQPVEN